MEGWEGRGESLTQFALPPAGPIALALARRFMAEAGKVMPNDLQPELMEVCAQKISGCIPPPLRLPKFYDDRQGFVGTPGPAKWRGSPACFAAEYPFPKVSFFRVFGPCGLQPLSQQSAPRLSRDACAFAEPFRRRLRGPAGAGHASLRCAGTRRQFTPRCLSCGRAPSRNHPRRSGRAADGHRAE